jgi:hypothetical protein
VGVGGGGGREVDCGWEGEREGRRVGVMELNSGLYVIGEVMVAIAKFSSNLAEDRSHI